MMYESWGCDQEDDHIFDPSEWDNIVKSRYLYEFDLTLDEIRDLMEINNDQAN